MIRFKEVKVWCAVWLSVMGFLVTGSISLANATNFSADQTIVAEINPPMISTSTPA